MARVGEDLSRHHLRPALEDPRTLSDQDLVAALMGSSTYPEGRPRQTVARDLLEQAGGLRGLAADFHSVCAQAEVDGESFFPVLAAFEMARRLAKANMPRRKPMDHPAAVASYLSLCYGLPDQEIMGALFLDIRNRLITEAEIFRGTLSRASVEPRTILKKALLCGASGLVLFHSHPSHDPTPSREDVLFTKRMVEAASLLGVWPGSGATEGRRAARASSVFRPSSDGPVGAASTLLAARPGRRCGRGDRGSHRRAWGGRSLHARCRPGAGW